MLRAISTRTPHAGSDRDGRYLGHRVVISTRTPHAGSDEALSGAAADAKSFQPALPMRGVTGDRQLRPSTRHISTRTPHAGSD